ncbi:unnamed protein product [Paramecium sonneborni]|uniref:Uncharacterized protein n=1 Tax=Paramecium sonneborni TaxID=65129 RepID=A0A8S1L933_9CILI|nr:unnamed protein product [Paramecium sonneborni]
MIKKASTFYVGRHRPSNEGLISPKGESIKFVPQSPNQREDKKTNRMNKTSLLEMKKSRKIALEQSMKRLNNKRRLIKAFRKVYLISMFISIAKQMDSKKLKGNHKKKIYESLLYPVKIENVFQLRMIGLKKYGIYLCQLF